jgi:hypothetical protein
VHKNIFLNALCDSKLARSFVIGGISVPRRNTTRPEPEERLKRQFLRQFLSIENIAWPLYVEDKQELKSPGSAERSILSYTNMSYIEGISGSCEKQVG